MSTTKTALQLLVEANNKIKRLKSELRKAESEIKIWKKIAEGNKNEYNKN